MASVSVVIPAYNRAHLIRDTIESALAQDIADTEILVVDDGSTDDTEAVVSGYVRSGRVRYLRQKNGGPASARNRGIANATAPLIALLDSDDQWHPDKLRCQLQLLERDPGLGLVFTGVETRDTTMERILRTYRPSANQRGDALKEILRECFVKTSSVIVRKDVLDRVGYFNTSLFGPEDWELFARILSDYPIDFCPEPYVFYRSHSESIQSNIDRWAENDLKAMDMIFALPRAREHRELLSMHYHRIYSEAGIGYFYRQYPVAARRYLFRSLRYRQDWHTLSYLLKTLIPTKILEKRRNLRRSGFCEYQ